MAQDLRSFVGAYGEANPGEVVRIAEPDRRAILPVPVHAVFEQDPDLSALLDTLAAARA